MFVSPKNPARRPPPAWGAVPLLGPALALGVGILLARTLAYPSVGPGLAILTIVLMVAAGLSRAGRANGRMGPTVSALLLLATAVLGFSSACLRHPPNYPDYFATTAGPGDLLEAEVTATRPTAKRLQFRLQVTATIDTVGQRRAVRGQSLVYVLPDEAGAAIGVGDRLLLRATIDSIRGPLNPAATDFRAYWAGQGIFHQLRLRDQEGFIRVAAGEGSPLTRWSEAARDAWLATLRPYLQGDELAVAAALVLGKKDLLSADVKSDYADTGAIHVLAVSGLHVGIVALILTTLLGGRSVRSRARRWVNALLTVIGVWLFALLTGFSPSVQRAAIMFTVLILGNVLRRRASLFNLLALAAILMLLWQPRQLFQVGFQLSFLAVAGIGIFARPLGKLVAVTGKFLRAIWSALVVSTSAQLGTLPLSLLYFGRFPLYFLLSGTLVVLSAYVILCLGILHGVTAGLLGWYPLARLTGEVLNFTIELQNAFIHFFGRLPGAVVEISGVDWGRALLLFLLLALLAIWLYWRRQSVATGLLTLTMVLVGIGVYGRVTGPPPPSAVIYHLPRTSLLDVFAYGQVHSLGSALDPALVERAAGGLRRATGGTVGPLASPATIDSVLIPGLSVSYPLVDVLGRRLLVLDGQGMPLATDTFPEVDLIWVMNGFRPNRLPEESVIGSPVLLVDGSSPGYLLDDWSALAAERNWSFHSTARAGAYWLTPRN